jgi:hypothetical protein
LNHLANQFFRNILPSWVLKYSTWLNHWDVACVGQYGRPAFSIRPFSHFDFIFKKVVFLQRRNGRVVECGGLENRCPFTRTGGSNPSFSATNSKPALCAGFFICKVRAPSLLERVCCANKNADEEGFELVKPLPFWDHEQSE